jgi:hypothetical protein
MIPEGHFSKGNVSKANVSEGSIPQGKVAVIAHDAGAANQIIHWFIQGDLSLELAYFSLSGPALELLENLLAKNVLAEKPELLFQNHTITDAIAQSDWVLAGTGWASDYEKEGMAEGIRQNKVTVAVFDHWVNYEPRLQYQDRILSVDQIWVTDVYAQALVIDKFPKTAVDLMPGHYLAYESSRVQGEGTPGSITFLMEPVRVSWQENSSEDHASQKDKRGEFQAFQFFLDNLAIISDHASCNITIRPHPSDPKGKYQHLEKITRGLKISVSSDESLYEALSTAEVVVGLNSYAMVVALAAGRKVFSVLPPIAPACVLPQPGIIELRTLI